MDKKLKMQRHELKYGPHFDEKHAIKAVSGMLNEDGTTGGHYSLHEAARLANQYGISLATPEFNEYDWYVALNMVYSDYFKLISSMSAQDHTKCFVKMAEAWLDDKDIEEGKMWHYYCYVMCDEIREELLEEDEEEEEEYEEPHYRMRHYYYDEPRHRRLSKYNY